MIAVVSSEDRPFQPEFTPGLVSVIVPSYNCAQFIGETITSLRDQSYRPIEVLVVDDGSTDDTEEIVQSLIDELHEVDTFEVYYYLQENSGAPVARNFGLHHSRGEFIQFVDSDDLLSTDKVAVQVEALKRENKDLACCPFQVMFSSKTGESTFDSLCYPIKSQNYLDWIKISLKGGGVPIHSYFFRRKLIARVGFWDEALTLRQDTDYMYRTFQFGVVPLVVDSGVAIYRRHGTGVISSNALKPSGLHSWLKVIEKVENLSIKKDTLDTLRKDLSFSYFLIARRAYSVDKTIAENALKKSCELVPGGFPQGGRLYQFVYRLAGFGLAQWFEAIARKVKKQKLPFGVRSQ